MIHNITAIVQKTDSVFLFLLFINVPPDYKQLLKQHGLLCFFSSCGYKLIDSKACHQNNQPYYAQSRAGA